MNTPELKNGIHLMHHLFSLICTTASAPRITSDGYDLVAELTTGPNEGQAVRLSRMESSITIELHHHKGSAHDPTHANEAFLTLGLNFRAAESKDAYRGHLYELLFWHKTQFGFMHLRSVRCKGLPFLIQFLTFVEEGRLCAFMWEDEIEASWKFETRERRVAKSPALSAS